MSWIAPEVARDSRVCASMTVPAEDGVEGAVGPQDRRSRPPPTCTRCQIAPHILGPACSPVTRPAACTFSPSPPNTRTRLRAWVLLDSNRASRSAPSPATRPGSYDLLGRISSVAASCGPPGVARLYGQFSYGSLPSRALDEARASIATARNVRSFIDELSASALRCSRLPLLSIWPTGH